MHCKRQPVSTPAALAHALLHLLQDLSVYNIRSTNPRYLYTILQYMSDTCSAVIVVDLVIDPCRGSGCAASSSSTHDYRVVHHIPPICLRSWSRGVRMREHCTLSRTRGVPWRDRQACMQRSRPCGPPPHRTPHGLLRLSPRAVPVVRTDAPLLLDPAIAQ